ncbi:hypothetical protein [Pectobacterium polaris]|uniref:hypothetical protein n=1 Tax=Pectobacterium polaris TaxID=2042057 RepID=UPI000F8CAFF9|nr:hypothetical protein [Pectobacterium polaris]RUR99413.1 hypothetical protein KHDHEBDM_01694 [Pectobacterium polaris]
MTSNTMTTSALPPAAESDLTTKALNNIDWHLEIRNTIGICMIVSVSEWTESVLAGSLPLKEQHLDRLSAAGIHSLFDVVRRTPDALAEKVKGFGISTARQVHTKCMGLVKDWELAQKQSEAA